MSRSLVLPIFLAAPSACTTSGKDVGPTVDQVAGQAGAHAACP